MTQTILLPVCIRVYNFDEIFRIEVFKYHVGKRQTMDRYATYHFETEEELNLKIEKLKNKYNVCDYQHYLQDEEDVQYLPHRTFHMYAWTPTELEDIFYQYFKRVYKVDASVSVQFDVYNGYLYVRTSLDEDMDGYESFVEQVAEDFNLTIGHFGQALHRVFEDYWEIILSDIIGKKLSHFQLTEDNWYWYDGNEYTWGGDEHPLEFYFYAY